VTGAGYRAVLGLFATGVTVIGAWDSGGAPRGMTANAFMAVSLDPPLIVVSVRRQARLHRLIEIGGSYGVSLLGEAHEPEARRFAGMPGAGAEPGARFRLRAGVPVLEGSLAWIAARVVDAHRSGDHTLFVSEVTELEQDRPDQDPLGFYRSSFARVIPHGERTHFSLEPWDHVLDSWG
jgi:flavin reductase (DIM6/NTAB) family NADH-FMN oxidoreductase RutF